MAVGTTRFGTDLAQSPVLEPTRTSFQVAALPTGKKLYATLLTKHNGVWGYRDLAFTAARADTFTFPSDSQVNVDMTKPFTWSTIPASQGAILTIGSTAFGTSYVNSGLLPPGQTSLKVPSFLSGTLYATLLTKTNGGYTRYQAISFTAAPAAAAMVTVVNSYFAAVNLKVNGQSFDLAPSQQVGPVAVIPASSGNDTVELGVAANPSCGLGDAQHYFDPGTSYRLSVFAGVGKCPDGSFAPNFSVVAT